ncbi:16S rRNA (uracil(1498)-N(3))-methyltransferase [Congregibacter litoralis]|uniref:Ribosomal RNA small subunit methyltransferase E n=1 Tax=Congregibacter litoralis KT71 TaxID=314285 RepID=A4AAP4_9GAMM|nr:16S rRNA (uracil(1498)-N(3))-methyltransferase [Congregibacter litoralis]EAQ96766.1 RNA methyltransferase, RsmE family [Congregibacter litoralis KT71]
MNLLIVEAEELGANNELELRGRRLLHLNTVLKVQAGDNVRVGQLNGSIGTGTVRSIGEDLAVIDVSLDQPAPAPLALTVVMALPRPKMLRRILRGMAETGIKEIHLINSFRVEKSYWQSPLLQAPALREALLSGLEQAMDTVMPTVHLHRRFRPFAEDSLPALCDGCDALLGDLGAAEDYPASPSSPSLLALGPEGGFIPFEQELIINAGARPVSLGPRMLRLETALHCAVGRHLGGHGDPRSR